MHASWTICIKCTCLANIVLHSKQCNLLLFVHLSHVHYHSHVNIFRLNNGWVNHHAPLGIRALVVEALAAPWILPANGVVLACLQHLIEGLLEVQGADGSTLHVHVCKQLGLVEDVAWCETCAGLEGARTELQVLGVAHLNISLGDVVQLHPGGRGNEQKQWQQ